MNERPAHLPDPNEPLLLAARYNDAEAEDHLLSDVVAKHDLDFKTLVYVAGQRALRMVLIANGRKGEISSTQMVPISFDENEQAMYELLMPSCVECIFLGWRAHQIADAYPKGGD